MRQGLNLQALGMILVAFTVANLMRETQLNAAAPAATGTVQAWVLQTNGKPVANAAVVLQTIPGRGQMPLMLGTANTDAKGKVTFNSIPTGTFTLQTSTLSSSASTKVTVFRNLTSSAILWVNTH